MSFYQHGNVNFRDGDGEVTGMTLWERSADGEFIFFRVTL